MWLPSLLETVTGQKYHCTSLLLSHTAVADCRPEHTFLSSLRVPPCLPMLAQKGIYCYSIVKHVKPKCTKHSTACDRTRHCKFLKLSFFSKAQNLQDVKDAVQACRVGNQRLVLYSYFLSRKIFITIQVHASGYALLLCPKGEIMADIFRNTEPVTDNIS